MIVSPSGRAYSRSEIQRLIAERKKRLRKRLLIFIPAGLAVAGIVVLLLVLFVFGGGMSPEKYRERAGDIHGEVMSGFQKIDTDWISAEYNEEIDFSEAYESLKLSTEEASTDIAEAYQELSALKPPQEMAGLHEELLAYYDTVMIYTDHAEGVFQFVSEWSKIVEEWSSKPWATEKVAENTTPAEIIAYLDEDISSLEACIAQFKALPVPEGFQSMLDDTVKLEDEGRSIIERIKRALINYDDVAFEAASRDMEVFQNSYADKTMAIWEPVMDFREEFWDLMDEGEELGRRLGDRFDNGENNLVTMGVNT